MSHVPTKFLDFELSELERLASFKPQVNQFSGHCKVASKGYFFPFIRDSTHGVHKQQPLFYKLLTHQAGIEDSPK